MESPSGVEVAQRNALGIEVVGRSCVACLFIYVHTLDFQDLEVVGAAVVKTPVAVKQVACIQKVHGNGELASVLLVVDEVLCKLYVEVMLEGSTGHGAWTGSCRCG